MRHSTGELIAIFLDRRRLVSRDWIGKVVGLNAIEQDRDESFIEDPGDERFGEDPLAVQRARRYEHYNFPGLTLEGGDDLFAPLIASLEALRGHEDIAAEPSQPPRGLLGVIPVFGCVAEKDVHGRTCRFRRLGHDVVTDYRGRTGPGRLS